MGRWGGGAGCEGGWARGRRGVKTGAGLLNFKLARKFAFAFAIALCCYSICDTYDPSKIASAIVCHFSGSSLPMTVGEYARFDSSTYSPLPLSHPIPSPCYLSLMSYPPPTPPTTSLSHSIYDYPSIRLSLRLYMCFSAFICATLYYETHRSCAIFTLSYFFIRRNSLKIYFNDRIIIECALINFVHCRLIIKTLKLPL
jgi:hypothetical protein